MTGTRSYRTCLLLLAVAALASAFSARTVVTAAQGSSEEAAVKGVISAFNKCIAEGYGFARSHA